MIIEKYSTSICSFRIRFILGCMGFFSIILCSCTRVDLVDKGQIILALNWSERTAGVSIPGQYFVGIGGYKLTFQGVINTLPSLYSGEYPIVVYNQPPAYAVSGTEISIEQKNGMLLGAPEWIFTAATQVQFKDNLQQTVNLDMEQQVRQLTIILTPEGGSEDRISKVNAVLRGVAGRWDFAANLPTGDPMAVPLEFVKQANGTWSAQVRILGLLSGKQELTGTVAFEDGKPADLAISADVTANLQGFNQNKQIPFSLSGSFETHTEAGFQGAIKDWKSEQEIGNAW